MPDEPACSRYHEWISSWVDAELEEAAASAVETHLSQCQACRAYAEAERASKTLVAATYAAPVDVAGLRARIRERLETRSAPKRRWMPVRMPRLAWGALAAVLIATLALGYLALLPKAMVEASPLIRAAASEHVGCMLGQLPLELTTQDKAAVAQWLRARLARPVGLPPMTPEGPATMSPRRAHLAKAQGAQILVERNGRMYSLFVMPVREVSGTLGTQVARAGRDFFVNRLQGHTVVFWRDADGLYCLVSDGEEADVLALAARYAGAS